jgi:hypothetical protein
MNPTPKYPRTYHFAWSEGAINDDKIGSSVSRLLNVPIVLSEKLDGGNCSLEANGVFARTHANIPTHPSFDVIKALHGTVKWLIPADIQLFGEAMYAKHSIYYDRLPGYFLLFGVHSIVNKEWCGWDDVKMWAEEIGVPTVPVLFEGIVSSEEELKSLTDKLMTQPAVYGDEREGVVVRVQNAFTDDEFSECVMKRVRKGHVQTDEHWMHQELVPNKLLCIK